MSDSDRLEDAGDVALALEGESADSIDERVSELEDVVERLAFAQSPSRRSRDVTAVSGVSRRIDRFLTAG